jgi:uncharacterized protein (TIGR03435 family)
MSIRISCLPVRHRAEALLLLGIVVCTGLASALSGQSKPEEPDRFEVASIQPSRGSTSRPSMEFTPGGGVRATDVTLMMLIQMAYGVRPEQLSGGPAWTDSEQYSVIAKGPQGAPLLSEAVQQELTRRRLQTLLGERFRLSLKIEADRAAGYVLKVEKAGHRMTLADSAVTRQLRQIGRWQPRAEGVEMPTLARFLGVHLQATVEDRTGPDWRDVTISS